MLNTIGCCLLQYKLIITLELVGLHIVAAMKNKLFPLQHTALTGAILTYNLNSQTIFKN
jgi:hypothetical protein